MPTSTFQRVAEFFKANRKNCEQVLKMVSLLGNGVRFKILCALKEGDFCVGELAELVEGKHANVSQQLKMLTLAGYVTKRREDQNVIYHLENDSVRRAIEFLQAEFTVNPARDARKKGDT